MLVLLDAIKYQLEKGVQYAPPYHEDGEDAEILTQLNKQLCEILAECIKRDLPISEIFAANHAARLNGTVANTEGIIHNYRNRKKSSFAPPSSRTTLQHIDAEYKKLAEKLQRSE